MLHVERSMPLRILRFPKRMTELLMGWASLTNRSFKKHEVEIMNAYIETLQGITIMAGASFCREDERKGYKRWLDHVRSRYENKDDPFVHPEELTSQNQRTYLKKRDEINHWLGIVLDRHPSLW